MYTFDTLLLALGNHSGEGSGKSGENCEWPTNEEKKAKPRGPGKEKSKVLSELSRKKIATLMWLRKTNSYDHVCEEIKRETKISPLPLCRTVEQK